MNFLLLVVLSVLVGKLFDSFASRSAFGVTENTWSGLAATGFAMILTLAFNVAIADFMR